MKLETVQIKNFKTLEEITLNFQGYYTAISGKNNAGKTNIIRVIRQVFKDQLESDTTLP